MKFFQPIPGELFESVRPCDEADFEVFNLFNGSALKRYWSFIKVERVTEKDGRALKPSDFPWLASHAFVCREKACRMLEGIFIENGEILPLKTVNDVDLYVFNSQVIDALDDVRSSILRSPDTGRITHVEMPEFVESMLLDVDIFRLPFRASPIYVSERFTEQYKSAGLVGLQFKEVWRSNNINPKAKSCAFPPFI